MERKPLRSSGNRDIHCSESVFKARRTFFRPPTSGNFPGEDMVRVGDDLGWLNAFNPFRPDETCRLNLNRPGRSSRWPQ
ncbi:unnamed protein product [Ectocarpus fasciculatus]